MAANKLTLHFHPHLEVYSITQVIRYCIAYMYIAYNLFYFIALRSDGNSVEWMLQQGLHVLRLENTAFWHFTCKDNREFNMNSKGKSCNLIYDHDKVVSDFSPCNMY